MLAAAIELFIIYLIKVSIFFQALLSSYFIIFIHYLYETISIMHLYK